MTISERPGIREDGVAAVTRELQDYITDAAAATPTAAGLWAEVRRAASGGKLVRPRLLIDAHRALGGTDALAEATAGAAFELLHTAFLIHDDVIDRDWTRRGEPNVAGAFRAASLAKGRRPEVAAHLGTSAAIIAGDLAVAGAVELAGRASDDAAVRSALARIVTGAVSATAAGELMDVELAAAESPDLPAVLAMYEAKTSVYSFCAPLQAGAVLAGADTAVVDALGRAGLALGVAYQITDDLLGTFGDPAITGKSIVSDAREGKHTVLATLMPRAEFEDLARSAMRSGRSIEQAAERIRTAMERSGARAAASELAQRKAREALDELEAVPRALRRTLTARVEELRNRSL